MRIVLGTLKNKGFKELRSIFASIPKTEVCLELIGDFDGNESSAITDALPYLARHVTAVTFGGSCIYVKESYIISEGSGDFPTVYGTQYNATIGCLLPRYVSSLPSSVDVLALSFVYGRREPHHHTDELGVSHDVQALASVIKLLPSNIKILDLSGTQFDFSRALNEDNRYNYFVSNYKEGLIQAFSSLSTTLKIVKYRIWPGHIYNFGRLSCDKELLSSISNHVEHLSLDDSNFLNSDPSDLFLSINPTTTGLSMQRTMRIPDSIHHFLVFLPQIHQGLLLLDLGNNALYLHSPQDLRKIVDNTPPNLRVFGLSSNGFAQMPIDHLCFVLKGLRPSVAAVDLGDNGLFFIADSDLNTILSVLPQTVKRLRLCEKNIDGINGLQVAQKLRQLPPHIDTFICSDSNLLGLSMADFGVGISGLLGTITTLDLSGNALGLKPVAELALLFSKIPLSIKKLILKRNMLSTLELGAYKVVFGALPENIEIDLSDNGFDKLLPTRLNQLLDEFPDILVDFKGKIAIKKDGSLLSSGHASQQSFLKPQSRGRIWHQQQYSDLSLVLMQLIQTKRLIGDDVWMGILLFILPNVPTLDLRRYRQVFQQFKKPVVSSLLPAILVDRTRRQEECLSAVDHRMRQLGPDATTLNLSRCGLNCLDDVNCFKSILERIPNTVTSLILRGNGFLNNEQTRSMFTVILAFLPRTIIYLDVSSNGFELELAASLKQLFINLPNTTQFITFGDEQPLSIDVQIESREWPASYSRLTIESPVNILSAACELIRNYTVNDSMLQRFFSLHWNRQNIPVAVKLVFNTDSHRITNIDDFISEMEEIKVSNKTGSLGRRMTFLYKMAAESKKIESRVVERRDVLNPMNPIGSSSDIEMKRA